MNEEQLVFLPIISWYKRKRNGSHMKAKIQTRTGMTKLIRLGISWRSTSLMTQPLSTHHLGAVSRGKKFLDYLCALAMCALPL